MTSCRTILRATLWFAMSLFALQQPAHAALVTARFEGRVSEISFTQFGDPVIAPTETTGLLPNSLGDSGIVMLSATYDDSIPDGNPFGASYQDSFTALSLNLQHNSSDGSVAPAIPPEGLNYELSTPRSSTVQMFNDLPTGGPGYLDFLLASMGIDGRRLGHTSIPAFRTWVPYSLDLEFAIESATPSSALTGEDLGQLSDLDPGDFARAQGRIRFEHVASDGTVDGRGIITFALLPRLVAVPEPATLALVAITLLTMAPLRGRQRSN